MCAGCIDSLRYRSEAECPYARRNGRADRIEDAGSQDGTDYQRSACGAQLVARLFSGDALSGGTFGCTVGCCRGKPEDGHLTAPSAMALYPIRVYAFLPEGVYRYDSKANVLNRVIEGDRRELTAMQDFAYTAPLNLVYVADYSVYADRNQPVDRIRFWCAADAGGYTENVNLYAAGNGLKAITRGSFKEEALLELLGLDPAQYGVILAQTVGR